MTKTPPKGKDKKIKTPKKGGANKPEKGTANEPEKGTANEPKMGTANEPEKGTTDGPNKPDADNDLTDTDNPFANGAPDSMPPQFPSPFLSQLTPPSLPEAGRHRRG